MMAYIVSPRVCAAGDAPDDPETRYHDLAEGNPSPEETVGGAIWGENYSKGRRWKHPPSSDLAA
jgi:hypothetical protein